MSKSTLKPLPVSGYTPQNLAAVALVNQNKRLEELVLRQLDIHRENEEVDQRMVALAKTKVEEAFMWLNRAVFKPTRLNGQTPVDIEAFHDDVESLVGRLLARG